jgi:hypothetical protein
MIAKVAVALGAAALGVAVIALRCQLGLHSWHEEYVGTSDYEAWVTCCSRCGKEPS